MLRLFTTELLKEHGAGVPGKTLTNPGRFLTNESKFFGKGFQLEAHFELLESKSELRGVCQLREASGEASVAAAGVRHAGLCGCWALACV